MGCSNYYFFVYKFLHFYNTLLFLSIIITGFKSANSNYTHYLSKENHLNRIARLLIDNVLKNIENGVLPWKGNIVPCALTNYVSGFKYTGFNRLALSIFNYNDARFLTASQIEDLGGRIRKGEQPVPVICPKYEKEIINKSEFNERNKLHAKPDNDVLKEDNVSTFDKDQNELSSTSNEDYYYLFNISQVEGISFKPPEKFPQFTGKMRFKEADRIIANYPHPSPNIEIYDPNNLGPDDSSFYLFGSFANYTPKDQKGNNIDRIKIRSIDDFEEGISEYWYANLFHELGHSTGAEFRLNRPLNLGRDTIIFISESKSKTEIGDLHEEIIADITSSYLCALCGIKEPKRGYGQFVTDLYEYLLVTPNKLISAAWHAEKAYKFILGEYKP